MVVTAGNKYSAVAINCMRQFFVKALAMPSRRWYFVGKICMAAAMFLLLLGETGCIAFPTKLPNRIRSNGGLQLQKRDVDFTFIKVGTTRRDEIVTKLAAIDVGSPAQFFWGRWGESSWGVVGGAVYGSDPSEVMGGSGRHWHFHNLLVKFDDRGVAEEQLTIDDDETLWQQLLAYSRRLPMTPTVETMRIPSTDKKYTEIVLSAETIQFRGSKPGSNMILHFPSPALIHFRPHFQKVPGRTELACYALEVDDPSAEVRSKANFCTSGQQLAQIVAYLDRLPAPAQWEGK
jgi:hypothetical protein